MDGGGVYSTAGSVRSCAPAPISFLYPGFLPKTSSKAEPEPYSARTSSARASPGCKRNVPSVSGTAFFSASAPCPSAASAVEDSAFSGTAGGASSGGRGCGTASRDAARRTASSPAARPCPAVPAVSAFSASGSQPSTPDTTASSRACASSFTASGIQRYPPATQINANATTSQRPHRFSTSLPLRATCAHTIRPVTVVRLPTSRASSI